MGTPWRGLLAPINKPSGDGRRFADDSVSHRALPLALKWQRPDDEGHGASVVVGSFDKILVDTVSAAVAGGWISQAIIDRMGLAPDDMGAWGRGEMFDDADPATMPRLVEDVAEALMLLDKGVIGPSVDAGAAEAILVIAGTDDPVSDEVLEGLWDSSGDEPELEMLFTKYEIAAATLVAIPAFAECRPFELLPAEVADEPAVAAVTAARRRALVAAAPAIPAEWFADPQLSEVTPLSVDDDGRIRGHVAAFGVCHTGIPGICTTAPNSASGYGSFHRYTVTASGVELPAAAGRITAGHGAMVGVCKCCPGNDDHACTGLSFGGAVAHHDPMRVLAYVRAGEDVHGIWVAGVVAPEADRRDRAALARQRFSGDWREVAGSLELTEVLALSRERPGFPLPRISVESGRQHALVAAGAVRPARTQVAAPALLPVIDFDYERMGKAMAEALKNASAAIANAAGVMATVTAADGENSGAMVALVPSEEDAARLAVEGGLPADDLHLTLMFLGEAADIDEDARRQIVDAATALVADLSEEANEFQVPGDGFAVSVFNPGDANDRPTAIVLGVGGSDLDRVHGLVTDALTPVFAAPEQHEPWVPHITLIESDDASLVEEFTDRVGPVVFDRLRVAFGGEVVDIPLSAPAEDEDPPVEDEAAPRAGQAAALFAELDGVLRQRDAADLCADLANIG